MINEQENTSSLNKMSDLEYSKNDVEMMRYRVNGLSYKLGLCAMLCSIFGCFICLNSMNANDFNVIIVILLNVVILLGGFLICEQAKAYSFKGSVAQIVFGGICAARIFYIPLIIIIAYSKYSSASNTLKTATDEATIAKAKADMSSAANNLGATITAKDGSSVANAYLPSNGYVRAIMAIVLFAAAAALFISAGIIGVIRSKKLYAYLESINQKM